MRSGWRFFGLPLSSATAVLLSLLVIAAIRLCSRCARDLAKACAWCDWPGLCASGLTIRARVEHFTVLAYAASPEQPRLAATGYAMDSRNAQSQMAVIIQLAYLAELFEHRGDFERCAALPNGAHTGTRV